MHVRRTKLAVALALLTGSGVPAAVAQVNPDASATAAPPPDIRIEVTGTNIKRVENEGALPVTVITRREIERSGATTPMELLQQISANNSLNAVTLGNST